MSPDKVLEKFTSDILRRCSRLPIITIYESPKDYPNKFVARLFDIDKPTKYIVIRESLKEIRNEIPRGMFLFPRYSMDDKVIIETYM